MLVLSPLSTVSVCTADELVPLETCHTGGRSESVSRRETASIVLPNLPNSHQFSDSMEHRSKEMDHFPE